MIKHVIFDIGNVLMSFDPVSYYQTIYHDEEKTRAICNIFSHEAWGKYDQGLLFLEDLYDIYHREYPSWQTEIDEVLNDWMALMQPIKESFSFMQELKAAGYHPLILSNISKDSADYLKRTQPFFACCPDAVLSYEEKLIKPDPALFHILLERYQLLPEECIFLDDSQRNIDVARTLGIHGVVFTSFDDAKAQVLQLLQQENGCRTC